MCVGGYFGGGGGSDLYFGGGWSGPRSMFLFGRRESIQRCGLLGGNKCVGRYFFSGGRGVTGVCFVCVVVGGGGGG